jgi:ribosomal protein L37E
MENNTPYIKHRTLYAIKCDNCGRKEMSCKVMVCQSCGGWMRYTEEPMSEPVRGIVVEIKQEVKA